MTGGSRNKQTFRSFACDCHVCIEFARKMTLKVKNFAICSHNLRIMMRADDTGVERGCFPAAVKMEEVDGSYACMICFKSVRHTKALSCTECTFTPLHEACYESWVKKKPEFADTCPQCKRINSMVPWETSAVSSFSPGGKVHVVDLEVQKAKEGKEGEGGGGARGAADDNDKGSSLLLNGSSLLSPADEKKVCSSSAHAFDCSKVEIK